MTIRIPHTESPTEVRQALQHLEAQGAVLGTGTSGYLLVAQGVGVTPVWQTIVSTIDHGSIGGLADDDHAQYHTDARGDARYYTETELDAGQLDNRYFTESEHINSSAGAGDAGKPIVLDADGHVDVTMINDADVDHGSIGGLGDDDHTIYSLADGTRDFSGVVVGVDPTASNHLATKEYVDSAISFIQEFFLTDTASGIGSYFNMVDQHTGEAESSDSTGFITQNDGQALTEWITVVNFPSITDLEHGIYSVHVNVEKTGAGARDVRIYFEVWTRTHPGGAETLRTTSEVSDLITSRISIDLHAILAADVAVNETDRMVVKFFANGVSGGNDATITLYSEGTTASHFGMPTSSEVLSTIFLRQDGTKALAGNMSVDAGITIDGRDISVDGTALDTAVGLQHAESHNIASHNDTTATGTELETLTDGSSADTLHTHTGISLSGIDISADTNLAVTAPIIKTDDTISIDQTDYLPSMTNNNVGAIVIGQPVYCDGVDGVDLADADSSATSEVIGLVSDTSIAGSGTGIIRTEGILTATTGQWDAVTGDSGGLTAGTIYYLSDATAGTLTSISPTQVGVNFVRVGVGLSTTEMKLLIGTQAPGEAVALPILDTNRTLYITTGGNDVTGNGTESSPWATLAQAISWLADKLISTAATVTIQIDDGLYEWTSTDTINHINGDKINIVGKNVHSLTMTSVTSSGATGNWAVVLTVDDSSEADVGDFVLIPAAISGGTAPFALPGCWIVTAVPSGTTITVTSTNRHTTGPTGVVAATVILVKTMIQYTGCDGITVAENGKLGLIDKLVVKGGSGADEGIQILANGFCRGGTSLGIWNFANNVISRSGGHFEGDYLISSNAATAGLRVYYATARAVSGVFSGCGDTGVSCDTADAILNNCIATGNVSYGIRAEASCNLAPVSARAHYNDVGIDAAYCSFINAPGALVNGNVSDQFDPNANTEGNILSYIRN